MAMHSRTNNQREDGRSRAATDGQRVSHPVSVWPGPKQGIDSSEQMIFLSGSRTTISGLKKRYDVYVYNQVTDYANSLVVESVLAREEIQLYLTSRLCCSHS